MDTNGSHGMVPPSFGDPSTFCLEPKQGQNFLLHRLVKSSGPWPAAGGLVQNNVLGMSEST